MNILEPLRKLAVDYVRKNVLEVFQRFMKSIKYNKCILTANSVGPLCEIPAQIFILSLILEVA